MTRKRYGRHYRRPDGIVCGFVSHMPLSNKPQGLRRYFSHCNNVTDVPKGNHLQTDDPITCLECLAKGPQDGRPKSVIDALYRRTSTGRTSSRR